ncbi:ATP-binding cassette, subfamily C, CydC [Alteromonadaceae bacterium Bs31]|nr:ATP-binding cassette, subfamily C, CydC [Alteromonadaceae bacterium Bs31]
MRLRPVPWYLIAVAIVAATSTLALLLLSSWFIAASALAGLSAGVVLFNYILPAAAIRLLAISRIASGYAYNYFGHADMLSRLGRIRSHLYDRVMAESQSSQLRAHELENLDHGTQALANQALAVKLPHLSFITLALALLICCWVLVPQLLALFVLSMALCVLLLAWHKNTMQTRIVALRQNTAEYRTSLEHQLRSASLWSLSENHGGLKTHQQNWAQAWIARRSSEYRAERYLFALAILLLLIAVSLLPQPLLGSPLLLLFPLLLLSMPDWLGAVVRAQGAAAESEVSALHLQREPQVNTAPPIIRSNAITLQAIKNTSVKKLSLQQFSWQRASKEGEAINAEFTAGDLVLVQGDSGSGKTSLLMAMAGLIAHSGQLHIQPGNSRLHYCDQHPHILADTLRHNLLIAAPTACDQQLQCALDFACLSHLHNALDQWLGDQGRILSGGEAKRIGLARAWLCETNIWLLDEPFEAIDRSTREQLSQHLNQARQERIILLVSHRKELSLHHNKVITLGEFL